MAGEASGELGLTPRNNHTIVLTYMKRATEDPLDATIANGTTSFV